MPMPVYAVRVAQYEEAVICARVEELVAALPIANTITPQTNILIKPNLLAKHPAEHAVTTHPEVVRAVIRACKARGACAEHITVADSSGGLYNPALMKSMYRACGLAAVCEDEGVCAYTACESICVPTQNGAVVTEFELLKPVVEADFIINLPKLKTHVMTGITAATKNLFGTIPGLKKAEWHTRFPDKERFGEMLIDLYSLVAPQIHLLDAVVGMEGDGPAGGTPREAGLLLASESALELDLLASALIGLDPMRVPYLRAAHGRGLCANAADMRACVMLGEAESATLAPFAQWALPDSYQGSTVGDVNFASRVPQLLRPLANAFLTHAAPHPVVVQSSCIGCGKCAEICPRDTIVLTNHKAKIQSKNCIRCFCCHEMCPVKAISVKQFNLFRL